VSRTCLPEGVDEAEFLAAVRSVGNLLAKQFAFRPFDAEDIRSIIAVHACEALPRYDRRRPLANFLFAHCKLRLLNHRRDHLKRSDSPCQRCRDGDPCGPDGRACTAHAKWAQFQARKTAVRQPVAYEDTGEKPQPVVTTIDQVEGSELHRLLDEGLPVELRSAYLRMLAGDPVDSHKRRRVQEVVLDILQENGLGENITL
jgi:hypothetical protein